MEISLDVRLDELLPADAAAAATAADWEVDACFLRAALRSPPPRKKYSIVTAEKKLSDLADFDTNGRPCS